MPLDPTPPPPPATPPDETITPADPPAEPTPEESERAAAKAELDKLAKAAGAKWREKQALRAERQKLQSQSAQERAELEAVRKELAFARQDPLGYVEQRGVPASEIAQRIIKRGSFEGTAEELRAELASIKAEREAEKRAAAESTYNASKQSAEEQLIKFVSDKEDDYPALSVLPPKELLYKAHALAEELVAKARKRGNSNFRLSTEDLLKELEQNEAPKFTRYQERRAKQSDKATEVSSPTGDTKATAAGSGQRGDRAKAPRTLSNGQASARGSLPVDFDRLPEKEQNRILAEQLKRARSG